MGRFTLEYSLNPVNQNLEGGCRNLQQKGVVYFDVAYTPIRAIARECWCQISQTILRPLEHSHITYTYIRVFRNYQLNICTTDFCIYCILPKTLNFKNGEYKV